MSERPSKKPRLIDNDFPDPSNVRHLRQGFLSSLERGISPPTPSRDTPSVVDSHTSISSAYSHETAPRDNVALVTETQATSEYSDVPPSRSRRSRNGILGLEGSPRLVPSPFKLTAIRDLPESLNVDTVRLHDILGNPLIKEAWVFNYCFDVDWMMQFFDSDVRKMIQVRIIHGSWRLEDPNKISIEEACARWPNVQAARAYLPDPFGTHHSKMFVLFFHDDTAEVIIHTANMLAKDWTNMTQAVWRSGALHQRHEPEEQELGAVGSGSRFKRDLLAYLETYNRTCQELHNNLGRYDFSAVRGALVASVPAKVSKEQCFSTKDEHLWGYPMLQEVITSIKKPARQSTPHLVAQVSSIATLGNGWMKGFVDATRPRLQSAIPPSSLSVIFPTAADVANSLDGYAAGGSIHTKAQSPTHLKQIDSLRPHLCKWTQSRSDDKYGSGRSRAAPHIKTYIQYNTKPTLEKLSLAEIEIDWALLTSANLSMQAWGSMPKSSKEAKKKSDTGKVHIQSFELGVLVWPDLFSNHAESLNDAISETRGTDSTIQRVRMLPVFGRDTPDTGDIMAGGAEAVIGIRMPYDLPLIPYGASELPWSPSSTYDEPDSHGRKWPPNG